MIRPSGRHVIDAEDEPERSRRPHSGRHDPGDDGPGGDECAGKTAEAPPNARAKKWHSPWLLAGYVHPRSLPLLRGVSLA